MVVFKGKQAWRNNALRIIKLLKGACVQLEKQEKGNDFYRFKEVLKGFSSCFNGIVQGTSFSNSAIRPYDFGSLIQHMEEEDATEWQLYMNLWQMVHDKEEVIVSIVSMMRMQMDDTMPPVLERDIATACREHTDMFHCILVCVQAIGSVKGASSKEEREAFVGLFVNAMLEGLKRK